MVEGRLGYNSSNQRYGVLVRGSFEHPGFHCGETMEVMLDGKWIPTRIEMSWDESGGSWYLVDTPYSKNLENIPVRIKD